MPRSVMCGGVLGTLRARAENENVKPSNNPSLFCSKGAKRAAKLITMVKVNESWETRAFEAAERRRATKQRKEEKNKKRSQKLNAQHLLALLDNFGDQLLVTERNHSLEVHMWTDCMPTDYDVDRWTESMMTPPRKGRSRSNSFVTPTSTPQDVKNHRRPRSNSNATPPATPQNGNISCHKSKAGSVSSFGKKSGRPRSSSNVSDRSSEDETPMLCSGYFYSGTCKGVERKWNKKGINGCIHGMHMTEGEFSLYEVLSHSNFSEAKSNAASDALRASKQAADANFENEDFAAAGQIDVLYHIPLQLAEQSEISNKLSEFITGTLSKKGCPIASIVHLVLDGVLIFDRYRDGIVFKNSDEQILLGDCKGFGIKRRTVSIGARFDTTDNNRRDPLDQSILEHHQHLVQSLPSQVMEFIALFLPDDMVARMALVCKSWNKELGTSSPDLWKKLLWRRKWPETTQNYSQYSSSNTSSSTERDYYRNLFISHYAAVRNLEAVVIGLESLESGLSSSSHILGSNKDLAMLHFKDSHGHYKSGETILRIFSAASVLLGNVEDCTLTLFDAAETSCGSYRRCRRRLSVSVVPFSASKRNKSRLISMDLDSHLIGCLFAVGREDDQRKWFGVVDRHDYLCAAGRGGNVSELEEGALRLFDLQTQIMESLLSCDDGEVIGWIYSHLMRGGEVDLTSVEVDVRSSIVACGNGQFMFEAIVLPLAFDDETDDLDLMSSALLKIFLFDASLGEIVWVGPTGISGVSTMQFWYPLKTSIVANKSPHSQSNCSFQHTEVAFVSRVSADLATILVGDQGDVACARVGKSVVSEPLSQEYGTWRRNPEYGWVAVATSSDIVVAECYNQVAGGSASTYHKTVLSFYPTGDAHESQSTQLTIEGNCNRFPIEALRGDHILVFSCQDTPHGASGDKSVFALLIDVPSRSVIHRICIDNACDFIEDCSSLCITAQSHSVAVASRKGMLLVGQDVKSFADAAIEKSNGDVKSPLKKKKKGGKKREAKKDFFARGMRQTLG